MPTLQAKSETLWGKMRIISSNTLILAQAVAFPVSTSRTSVIFMQGQRMTSNKLYPHTILQNQAIAKSSRFSKSMITNVTRSISTLTQGAVRTDRLCDQTHPRSFLDPLAGTINTLKPKLAEFHIAKSLVSNLNLSCLQEKTLTSRVV